MTRSRRLPGLDLFCRAADGVRRPQAARASEVSPPRCRAPAPRWRLALSLALSLAMALAWAVAGCVGGPEAEPAERVRISDLRSRVTPPHEDPELAGADTLPPQALITRMDIPRAVSLARAWREVSQEGLDPSMVERWGRNGLRVGTLPLTKAEGFLAGLADALEGRSQLRIRAPFASGVSPNEPLASPRRLSVELVPGVSQTRMVTAGRFQLLFKLGDAPGSRVAVEVTPHQHLPERSFEVRTPMERELDGRIFTELKLAASLRADQLLVIGFDPDRRPAVPEPGSDPNAPMEPEEQPEEPQAGATSQPATSQPATSQPAASQPAASQPAASQPAATQPDRKPRMRPVTPLTLGEIILTTQRQATPVHVVYVVGVQPRQRLETKPATAR